MLWFLIASIELIKEYVTVEALVLCYIYIYTY